MSLIAASLRKLEIKHSNSRVLQTQTFLSFQLPSEPTRTRKFRFAAKYAG